MWEMRRKKNALISYYDFKPDSKEGIYEIQGL
jgi:hypothetical protein